MISVTEKISSQDFESCFKLLLLDLKEVASVQYIRPYDSQFANIRMTCVCFGGTLYDEIKMAFLGHVRHHSLKNLLQHD